jgi:hypothetical protein
MAVNLTQTQLLEVIAVLLNNIQIPFAASVAENGLFINGAGQLQFPDNAYNQSQALTVNATGDGTNIYVNVTGSSILG